MQRILDRSVGDFFVVSCEMRKMKPASRWLKGMGCALLVLSAASALAAGEGEAKRAAPQRIISLSPSITETLFALGAGDRVVGVTQFCDRPGEAKAKPKVGGIINPDLEAIVVLKPDLVIAQKSQAVAPRLGGLGIATLEIRNANIRELMHSYAEIGAAIGAGSQAQKLLAELEAKIKWMKQATRKVKRVKVLLVVDRNPLYVAGGKTFIDELIALAGGKNIFGDSRAPYPQVSLEEIMTRAPEVIIEVIVMPGDKEPVKSKGRPGWERWGMIPAVASGRIYNMKDDSLLRPGPRLAVALEKLFSLLHPDLARKALAKEKDTADRGAPTEDKHK